MIMNVRATHRLDPFVTIIILTPPPDDARAVYTCGISDTLRSAIHALARTMAP